MNPTIQETAVAEAAKLPESRVFADQILALLSHKMETLQTLADRVDLTTQDDEQLVLGLCITLGLLRVQQALRTMVIVGAAANPSSGG